MEVILDMRESGWVPTERAYKTLLETIRGTEVSALSVQEGVGGGHRDGRKSHACIPPRNKWSKSVVNKNELGPLGRPTVWKYGARTVCSSACAGGGES